MQHFFSKVLSKARGLIDRLDWRYCDRDRRWHGPAHDVAMTETSIALVSTREPNYRAKVFKREYRSSKWWPEYYVDLQVLIDNPMDRDDGTYQTILFLGGNDVDIVGEVLKEAGRAILWEKCERTKDGDGVWPPYPKKVPPTISTLCWEGNQYGVTINGRVCGAKLDYMRAELVREWLESAFTDIAAQMGTMNYLR